MLSDIVIAVSYTHLTEMYVDSFVDMAKAGRITGRCKNIDNGR